LDYGCGTGEILNFLSPAFGIGYDPSRKMIKIAKKKFSQRNKNLAFTSRLQEVKGDFDYVVSVDTIEHFANPAREFKKMAAFLGRKTKLVISYVDSKWDWLIKTLALIRPKTPEGPHKRITRNELIEAADKAGLKLLQSSNSAIPVGIFVFEKNRTKNP
jgi:2-polyprenyl-3-methyl-5-hydroxy-6-metoxy-1,4-benzoquinol methylase